MGKYFFDNQIVKQLRDKWTAFMLWLKNSSEFKKEIQKIWRIFEKDCKCSVLRSDIHKVNYNLFKNLKMLSCIYHLFFPQFTKDQLDTLSSTQLKLLILDSQDERIVTFTNFVELFAELSTLFMEEKSLGSCKEFIRMIKRRITRKIAYDVINGRHNLLEFHVDVKGRNTGDLMEFWEYEERVQYEQFIEQKVENEVHLVVKRQLMDMNDIVPLGFSAENWMQKVANQATGKQFERNNVLAYRVPHYVTRKYSSLKDVRIIVEQDINELNQRLFGDDRGEMSNQIYILCIIRDGDKIYRLNPFLAKKVQFEWLKNKKGEMKYYNLESTFYEVEEYQLDLKHKLHKDHDKLKQLNQQKSMAQTSNLLQGRKSQINERNVIYKMVKQSWRKMKETKNSWFDEQIIAQFREQNLDRDQWAKEQLSLSFNRLISKEEKLPMNVKDTYNDDLLNYAKSNPLQILVIGKPKIGRSTLCKELETKADIEHIEINKLIDKVMIRMKELEETPEQDGEGNPIELIDSLGALEWQIIEDLKNGQAVEHQKLLKLINKALSEKSIAMRGYILDLPLIQSDDSYCWIDDILNNRLILPKIKCRYFTHIIQLDDTDNEVLANAQMIWSNPETGKCYSEWNRHQLRKPLTTNEDDPVPDLTEEEEKERQMKDEEMVQLPLEEINRQLMIYNQKTMKKLNKLIDFLPNSQIITIENCIGMTPSNLSNAIIARLKNELIPLRPLAIKLEGGGEKDLLTQGLEDGKVSRVWSKYYQMDPVELQLKGRVVAGKGEFSCEFGGRVFLFDTEENQNEFVKNPRAILSKQVEMPRGYNVAIVGPRLSGKKTYAKLLADKYNWIIVDVQKIVGDILIKQKEREKHISSNPDPKNNGGMVHLSEIEFKELIKGNALPTKDIIPLLLDFLKYPLFKRGKRVIEEEQGEEKEEEIKKEVADKKPKRQQQKKKEDEAQQDAAEIFEDIILAELGVNASTFKDGFIGVKGVILINYPLFEDDINMLKWHQLALDKIIYLVDTNEEQTEPGTYLAQQRKEYLQGDISIENELQVMENIGKVLKEQYTEEIVKEICIIGSIQEVFQRMLLSIDPFICRVDEESTVRAQGEMPEGEEIPWGEYGPFCPVTMKDNRWSFYGKEEFEIQIEGKRYRCFGQNELNKLKQRPSNYVKNQVIIPPARVMITGIRGSGVHTQLELMNQKYRISVMKLKEEFLELLEMEKEKRKRERKLNKGFKPKEFDEEGKEIEDAEILEENAEFDKRKHEVEMIELLMSGYEDIFINGNFYDVEEDKVTTPLVELLTDAKKLPEIIIMLRVNEKNFFQRQFDQREVQLEYERLMEERRIKKQQEKEEAKRAAQAAREEAGEEEQEEQQEEQEEEEQEEEDPDAPKLEEMIQERKDKLQQQREADLAKIEDYAEQFKAIQVPVIIIDADRNIDSVFKNICFELKQALENRKNLIEKHLVYKLEEEKVVNYEKSYVYKKSIYGNMNALNLSVLPIEKKFGAYYRERIYYFLNEEERANAMNQPLDYINKIEPAPLDVSYAPKIFLIGFPKSGKSSVAKMLKQNLNIVHIKISHILRNLQEQHFSLRQKEAYKLLQEGQQIPDEICVALIKERIQMSDCYENGFALDGYPETLAQAELLINAGIKPDLVFHVTLDEIILKQRVIEFQKEYLSNKENVFKEAEKKEKEKEEENPPEEGEKIFWSEKIEKMDYEYQKFGFDLEQFQRKLVEMRMLCPEIEIYFNEKFDNCRVLNTEISKWGVFDLAKKFIFEIRDRMQDIARGLVTKQPHMVANFALDEEQILRYFGLYQNYCPVAYRTKKEFQIRDLRNKYLAHYNFKLYNLSSEEAFEDFKRNPNYYIDKNINKQWKIPKQVRISQIFNKGKLEISHKKQIFQQQQYFQRYDVVDLYNKKLSKGLKNIMAKYCKQYYCFKNVENLRQFLKCPQQYYKAKLPQKLPLQENTKKDLKNLQNYEDAPTYLENSVGNIVMKVLAQLGYQKLKYPNLTPQETSMKFISICLKANNIYKDQRYRNKYQEKLNKFLKHCEYSQDIMEQYNRKSSIIFIYQQCLEESQENEWTESDELNLQTMTEQYDQFLKDMQAKDKETYFYDFIR